MKTGIELIAEERKRQIEIEGWTARHDAGYTDNQLALAAIAYAAPEILDPISISATKIVGIFLRIQRHVFWPWNKKWWKPTPDNRVRELAKAGALIAAEIDRLQNIENEE